MEQGLYRLRNQRARVMALVGAVGLAVFVGVSALAGANPGGARVEVGFAAGTPAATIRAIEARFSLTEVRRHQPPEARLVTVSRATESLVIAELRAVPEVIAAEPLPVPVR
jgi:hypothetical protein